MENLEEIFKSKQSEVIAKRKEEEVSNREKNRIFIHNVNFLCKKFDFIRRARGEFVLLGNELSTCRWFDIISPHSGNIGGFYIDIDNEWTDDSLVRTSFVKDDKTRKSFAEITEIIAGKF